jgi:uncharacterized membrane protein
VVYPLAGETIGTGSELGCHHKEGTKTALMTAFTQSIELIVQGLEILGVSVIGIAFPYATIRGLVQIRQRRKDAYQQLKIFIGKALQLGLESLVAADIVRTVAIELTREGIVSLGLLILVRTFLDWSITVEIEGCWPWQIARSGRA